jgi:ATP-dependent helicase/nuclease subunit B
MSKRLDPAVFSIPPDLAFSDALVDGVLKQFGDDRLELAQGLILVPNNRAALALQDAFVRRSAKGLLLPRLVPIGDPDLGENIGAALDFMDGAQIPPAIDPLQRQMILARKLQQIIPVERMGRLDGAQAMRLAAELGRVIDQLTIERKSSSDLRDIDDGDLSQYWAESLTLLSVIIDEWPQELAKRGTIDLADRRNRQLDRLADGWRLVPPKGFVIAAGISTTAPAIADLLKVIARMERGQIVLAGLDFGMKEAAWDSLLSLDPPSRTESHPQFHLRLLIDAMGFTRNDVQLWSGGARTKDGTARGEAVSRAMDPARFTQEWAHLAPAQRRLKGVHALEVSTPAEEAQTIALALRATLETPGKTAALVTPDRALARRVSAHLKRWSVEADDSAGKPLSATPPGTLLLALANAAADQFSPVSLLTLLKHPLVTGGSDRPVWLDGVRKLDLALRGPRAAPHLAGTTAHLAAGDEWGRETREAARTWWPVAERLLGPLEAIARNTPTIALFIAALRDTASALAGEAVWAGEDGRAAADLIASLEAQAVEGPQDVSISSLPHLLRDQLDALAIRPARGGHPRLFIWGLLEAKLQTADLMVLGGLNETVWPQMPSPDPWLAPAIRRQLNLPSLERRIGLSAHDLVSAMGAKEVLLTRTKRDTRSPAIASRFWLRLETLADGFDAPSLRYDLLARQIDHADGNRAARPKPTPPSGERPRRISVTDVDGLKADPYSFYAKKMLKLSALNASGEEPDGRWRGSFLHDVLHKWGEEDGFEGGALKVRLNTAFDQSGLHPVVRAMWQPRFDEAAETFENRMAELRTQGRMPLAMEVKGSLDIGGVTLTGRADRIDVLPDGSLAIIDYKTGKPPSDAQVLQGFALQLGLIGLLADAGSFAGVAGQSSVFEYWSQTRVKGRPYGQFSSPTEGKRKSKSDPAHFVAEMTAHFEAAVAKWLLGDAPFTAKLHPERAYSEFDQLMRFDEWQGRDG